MSGKKAGKVIKFCRWDGRPITIDLDAGERMTRDFCNTTCRTRYFKWKRLEEQEGDTDDTDRCDGYTDN